MAEYVNNESLYKSICSWKQQCRESGEIVKQNDQIGTAIMKIANGLSKYYKFSRYTPSWKEEMVSDAIESSVKGLINFDETKYNNPHAYITMMCYNAFIQRIKFEKKEQAKKYNFFLEAIYTDDDDDLVAMASPEFISDLYSKLEQFETKKEKEPKPIKMASHFGLDFLDDLEGLEELEP